MKLKDTATLRSYLAASGMTQNELARKVGVSKSFVSQLMNGGRSTCAPQTGILIEHYLTAKGKIFDPTVSDEKRLAVASSGSAA